MIAITEIAREKLASYLQENNISSPLRIALMQAGCAGTALGLALDETKESDLVQSFDDLTVCMDKELLEQCESVAVDFVETGKKSGFSITSSQPVPGAGGACGSGSSSCGSGGCGC